MKKIIYIVLFFFTMQASFAQQDEQPGEGTIREKMVEYIQNKLGLSKGEAEKFQPVFIDYFRELKRTNRDFKGQGLELQQKIIEVRLRFREQFKPIIGEKRSNDVFTHERDFVQTLKVIRQERLEGRANKRNNFKLFSN